MRCRFPFLVFLTLLTLVAHALGQTLATSIEIDLQEQRAYLIEDGRAVLSTPICSGRPGHFTETGSFKVIEKERRHYSNIYGKFVDRAGRTVNADADADMPVPAGCKFVPWPMNYFLRFNSAEGMHSGYLPGYPASHGCVRLPEQNAIAFFNAVEIGTPVTVFGRTPVAQGNEQTRWRSARRYESWPNDPRYVDPRGQWTR